MKRVLLLCLLLAAGCEKTYFINSGDGGSATPTAPSNPVVNDTKVEFRVVGTASSVRVRFSSPADGINQTVTTLPYSVSFNTTQSAIFLSLDVTPISYPTLFGPNFLVAQIVVNGSLFREASSQDSLLNTLTVSGTWRR